MPNLKIGVQLASLRQPFKKALHTAAQLGAQAVEIDARHEFKPQDLSQTAIRQLRKLLEDLNLHVSAVSFPTRRGYDVLDDLEPRIAATRAAMKFAYEIGARVVVNHVGSVPDDRDGGSWQVLVEALTALGNYGHHVGALLAASTGGNRAEDLAQLLDALPAGGIGVDLNPGHLAMLGHSAVEAVEILGPQILHVHACDGVRDVGQGRGLEVELGRGTADVPAVLAGLEEHGYRGWLTVERRYAEDPVGEIANAVAYLKSF